MTNYADVIMGMITQVRTLLRASTRTELAAIPDLHINYGQPQTNGMNWPGINIMVEETAQEYTTVLMIEIAATINAMCFITDHDAQICHENAIKLAGDVFDEVTLLTNDELSGWSELTYPPIVTYTHGRGDSGYITVAEVRFIAKRSQIIT